MSFVAITSGEITSGEPVSAATQTKIKNNFDDHESRIQGLESSSLTYPPVVLSVGGPYIVMDNVLITTTTISMVITGGRILINAAGSSGITEVDIKRKRGGGSFQSIFSTRPSVSYSVGNYALSSNGVLDPSMADVASGDILRLDITSGQLNGDSFLVRLDYIRGV